MKRVLVASRRVARAFSLDEPYAVVSFVGTYVGTPRTAPRIPRPPTLRGRIVIACDDVLVDADDGSGRGVLYRAMLPAQARRIARFVETLADDIDTLLVHCLGGHSRSAGAGKAVADAYGIPVSNVVDGEEFAPNEHVYALVASALAERGRDESRASYDPDACPACGIAWRGEAGSVNVVLMLDEPKYYRCKACKGEFPLTIWQRGYLPTFLAGVFIDGMTDGSGK